MRGLPPDNVLILVNGKRRHRGGVIAELGGSLSAGSQGAVFTLVDHPHLKVETLQAVLGRFAQSDAEVVIPRHGGQRGHPVAVSRSVADELLAIANTAPVRGSITIIVPPSAPYSLIARCKCASAVRCTVRSIVNTRSAPSRAITLSGIVSGEILIVALAASPANSRW